MDAIHQTRFFAKNYSQLQGLRVVPTCLCLLLITWWANVQSGPARDLTFPTLICLASLALYLLVDWYYNRVYGKVKHATIHTEQFIQAGGAALALAAFIVDNSHLIRVSLLGLIFAMVFIFTGLWYWRPTKGILALNLILALVFVGLSIAPIFGFQDWWRFFGLKNSILAFTFLFGAFGLIGGATSHLYFKRSLPSAPEPL